MDPFIDSTAFESHLHAFSMPTPLQDARWSAHQQASFWLFVEEQVRLELKPPAATLVQFLNQEGYITPHRKNTMHVRNRGRLWIKFNISPEPIISTIMKYLA